MKEIDNRPHHMIISEAKPTFRIIDSNEDWSKLCGCNCKEAIGSILKELLQGPETNTAVNTDLIALLL